MDILTFLSIGILTIVIIVFIVYYFESKKPQTQCKHEMETIKTWSGEYSNEYLSTCKKCGLQRTHIFSGTNMHP